MSLRVLFIGGTGNISESCARLLHERGNRVAVLTRGRNPVPGEYEACRADRKDPASLRAALANQEFDVVLNFLGYDLEEVKLDYDVFKGRVGQYVFISSTTVYAKPPVRLPMTESGPFGNPWWEYARKKQACEEWLLAQWREKKFPVTIVRPSHTYSRRWVPNAISSGSYTFAVRLKESRPVFVHDEGESPWTLTSATDFAAGLAGLLACPAALGEAFHITSDEVLTWNAIYAEIASALGVSEPVIVKIPTDFICSTAPRFVGTLKGDKAHPGVFDNSKLKSFVPGFACRKTFRQGIRESVEWLEAHPDQQNCSAELEAVIDQVVAGWRRASAV